MINIAVLVSGGGTNLQALIDAQGKVLQHGKIKLVISSKPDVYALQRAKQASIDHCVIAKRDYKTQEEFSNALLQQLQSYQIDMIVLAGYLSILDETIIRAYPNRIINIHPSLIPSFCGKGYYGLKVHEAALHYGVKVTGATVHIVNEIPDGGKILLQKAVDILPTDTPETLQQRVMEEAEWILLPQATEMIAKEIEGK
ncbi:phosphoribosylglycinamide formyltransferase [Solobacterium sp.]|uniref:phosphoribosylglycinamide formyltransferase n=1 Tax=Solobacterium sp. TaxID=2060878 RepID=UPI001CB052F8|nr:phosphoribosylglycinamide formyltransferase [Solobacterium sp.]MBF1084982.1 phosphoribosylglycinamide formyltransferase [Solobacterium sp.]MBF1107750.1 phosphoribosylglycinamide formyltransferase [Solobacterium sp.]MBF1109820.1 phosphoribosylglycinamide formyltransferase [Solobacterium sp.]